MLIRGIYAVVNSFIEMRAKGGREMRASGESEHAKAIGIDVPFCSPRAHNADSALHVLQRSQRFRIRAAIGHTILHKNTGDVDRVQPVADFGAFEIHRKDVISAAGENDNSGSRRIVLRLI